MNSREDRDTDTTPEVGPALLSEFGAATPIPHSKPWLLDRKGVLKDVPVRLQAVLGHRELTVGKLTSLKDGDVLALEEEASAPVELHIEGQLVARGELVVVGEKYGVRSTELAAIDEG